MKTNLLILLVFLGSFSYGQKKTNISETYDVVILNWRVIDSETMFDDIANVGIKDGVKSGITTSEINGKEIGFSIEENGRFIPIDQKKWSNDYMISLNADLLEMHLHDDSGAGKRLNKE